MMILLILNDIYYINIRCNIITYNNCTIYILIICELGEKIFFLKILLNDKINNINIKLKKNKPMNSIYYYNSKDINIIF